VTAAHGRTSAERGQPVADIDAMTKTPASDWRADEDGVVAVKDSIE